MKAPKAPDPYETAQAQAGMNRDTAITQQQINMVDQYTPDGSLVYSQIGQEFSPSETGQQYWYNPTTGAYSSTRPVSGYQTTGGQSSSSSGMRFNPGGQQSNGAGWTPSQSGSSTSTSPVYEGGWQEVRGNLTPRYKATTTLSEAQQAIKNQADRASLNLGTIAADQSEFLKGYLGKGVDTSGAPGLLTSIGGGFSEDIGGGYSTEFNRDIGGNFTNTYAGADDFSADRQRYEDAILERMAPRQQQDEANLRNQLIQSGIRPGTAAWDSEYARLSSANNDARLGAILAAGDEQARMVGLARDAAIFGNEASLASANFDRTGQQATNAAALGSAQFRNDAALTSANFTNNARSQYLSELYAERNQPIQEISALLGGTQVQSPNFVSTPTAQVGGVDYTGLVNQKYQSELASYQSGMGGLFGLGSALVGALPFGSDRRLKEDIKPVGKLDNGLTVYSYRYKGQPGTVIGLMADEVKEIHPEAVVTHESGFDMVYYDRAVK